MAIFSFKSKTNKTEEVTQEEKSAAGPAEIKPAKKFVPKHARAESAQAIEKISITNQRQKQDSSFYSIPADGVHPIGSSTTSLHHRRFTSNDAFTTTSSDYFSPGALRKLSANDASLGYVKVALARRDQGWAQGTSDSGYESASPSRVPSEQRLDDMPRNYLPQINLLPETRLVDDSRSERSLKSVTKKTRFQVEDAPVSAAEPAPSTQTQSSQQPLRRPLQVQTTLKLPGQLPASSMSSLAALEGFKVNKKGKVLDEEGDLIGELVEGELLDCVRQKVNAQGQVMDDLGKIVGIVKLATTIITSTPLSAATQTQTAGGLSGLNVDGETSPTNVAPRSPNFGSQSSPDTARRSALSASERSLSDLSKHYARPPMSSVPENNVPEDETLVASPELFAYKGEIPVAPTQYVRRRSSSPPFLDLPASVRRPSHPRRVSSSAISSKSLGKQPVGYYSRRAYGSFDNSPNGSDDGTETSNSDEGKMPYIAYGRAPGSIRSSVSVPAKPRTYFSHAGRVTVDPNDPLPTPTESTKTKPATEPVSTPAKVAEKEEKKKSKFGLRFGKK